MVLIKKSYNINYNYRSFDGLDSMHTIYQPVVRIDVFRILKFVNSSAYILRYIT